jgi:hypothetical protein
MDWDYILNDLIGELNPEFVPFDFIIAAKYMDRHGFEHIMRGQELRLFLLHPDHFGMHEVQVVLDVSRIRRAMYNDIVTFFVALNDHMDDDHQVN